MSCEFDVDSSLGVTWCSQKCTFSNDFCQYNNICMCYLQATLRCVDAFNSDHLHGTSVSIPEYWWMLAKSLFHYVFFFFPPPLHMGWKTDWRTCIFKLHSLILTAASRYIKATPSDGQKKKVEGFVNAEKARRKMDKIRRSSVKQARSGKGSRFDF